MAPGMASFPRAARVFLIASILLRLALILGRPRGIELFSGWNPRATLASILRGTNQVATGCFPFEAMSSLKDPTYNEGLLMRRDGIRPAVFLLQLQNGNVDSNSPRSSNPVVGRRRNVSMCEAFLLPVPSAGRT